MSERATWRHADGSVRVDHMDAQDGDYFGCSIYRQHGACSCSTGVPGNQCPLTMSESEGSESDGS